MLKLKYILLLFVLSLPTVNAQKTSLRDKIKYITDSTPGNVGVCFISDHGDTVNVNATEEFPLMSVMKFHQALAVCDFLNTNNISLDSLFEITSHELNQQTYSPMLEKYPYGGTLSIRQLLDYSLIISDNNASNILYNRVVNVHEVNRFAHELINEIDTAASFHILYSEETMGRDVGKARENWTTPLAAARLMSVLYSKRNDNQYLWNAMSQCNTGQNRIPHYISEEDVTIVHKTGTGGTLPDGTVFAVNDLACVILPDGRHYFLSVFVSDARCEFAKCEEVIADISKLVYDYMTE
ncbi:MAG: class A beta-lactamase-related serine hydrolase [Paludibacteraceae bacterium]|nr:class A beta-lactamase-related serine hydrolase [Paludibacteraceae bacterium]